MASTVVEEQMRIFEYAKVADWESRLQTLATMAEPVTHRYDRERSSIERLCTGERR